MNVSFGAFRIVNSYGAFGSITKVRNEVGTVLIVVVVVVIVVLVLVVILVVIVVVEFLCVYVYYYRLFYRVQMKAFYTQVLYGKTLNLLANLEILIGETQNIYICYSIVYIYIYIYIYIL